jgi:hypothetical protein
VAFGRRPLPLERRRDGSIVVGLEDNEREVLRNLISQLRMLVRTETSDTIDETSPVRRLFPTAYPSDNDREDEYQEMVREPLVEQRLASIDTVEQTLDSDTLDDDSAGAWMRTLNDLRLVVGTRLDVSEDQTEIDPDDPDAHLHAVYDYLGFLVDRLVMALTQTLPDQP